jgi:ArsR family transcriptional regulator, arsenate/arsenite/antimonite-responsive transcriptional repressor
MDQVVQIYKALSEEMRLRIMMLLTHGELCVCDLMAIFNEPQSKISRHLAYLKNSGLITGKRVGVWMHYSVRETLDEIARAQLEFMGQHLSSLGWSREDMKKMEEVKAQKLCETDTAGKGRDSSSGTAAGKGRKG